MKRDRSVVYAVCLLMSVMLHYGMAVTELPVRDDKNQTTAHSRLKISLKKHAVPVEKSKPKPKSPVEVKKAEVKPLKKKKVNRKVVKKKVKKKIVKPVNKQEEIINIPAEVAEIKEELPAQTVYAAAEEVKAEPEAVQIKEEPDIRKNEFDFDAYMGMVLNLIDMNKSYPYLARKKGQEGVVNISALIDENGEMLEINLEESSGHRLLDKNAMKLVASVFPLDNKPDERVRIVIPVRYSLE